MGVPVGSATQRVEVAELEPCRRIAVVGAGGADGADGARYAGVRRLLGALERVRPVRFVWPQAGENPRAGAARGDGMEGVAAVIELGGTHNVRAPATVPRLVLAGPGAGPAGRGERIAAALGDAEVRGRPGGATGDGDGDGAVTLADDELLARPLRGLTMPEDSPLSADGPLRGPGSVFEPPLAIPAGARVLARVGGRAVWWHAQRPGGGWLEVCAFPLAELGEADSLREHLRAGRCMGLLPLLRFLDGVLGADGWTLPPLRASFVIDDPNLHCGSYGYIDYRELVAHATTHGYHVGLATVPLDGWLVNRGAAGLIGAHPGAVSLLMHGNDHVARELGRLHERHGAELTIAQALRRVARLEERAGVGVRRVMAPPHGACSRAALAAMMELGMEAACVSRPYPWRDSLPPATPLAGWLPAEMVAGGMPVLGRVALGAPRADLALRALLGQPLILYGHHGDVAGGLDVLGQAAAEVNRLGEVRWGPLDWIARTNCSTRRSGEMLLVRMHARRVALRVPRGVREVRVVLDVPVGEPAWRGVAVGGRSVALAWDEAGRGASTPVPLSVSETRFPSAAGSRAEPAPLAEAVLVPGATSMTEAGAGLLHLELVPERALDPACVPAPRRRPWPLLRRVLVEGRDRLQPLARPTPARRAKAQARRDTTQARRGRAR